MTRPNTTTPSRRPRLVAAAVDAAAKARGRGARRLARLLEWVPFHVWIVNADNNRRDQGQLAREFLAMGSTKPLAILVCEAIGNRLPQIPGMTLYRDRSDQSRANLALYLSNDYRHGREWWVRLRMTWARKPGRGSRHPSRAVFRKVVGRIRIVVFHAPPRARDGVKAQPEHFRALVRLMVAGAGALAQLRPRLAGGDINARVGERELGGDDLADAIGGQVHGNRIDTLVSRGQVQRTSYDYLDVLPGGVPFEGDHGRVLRVDMVTAGVWLPLKAAARKRRR